MLLDSSYLSLLCRHGVDGDGVSAVDQRGEGQNKLASLKHAEYCKYKQCLEYCSENNCSTLKMQSDIHSTI